MGYIDPEKKRASLEKWVKVAFIAVGCALTSTYAFYALTGLIMWAAFVLGVVLVLNFAPVVGTWIANKRIQALVAVIEANPIETMLNLYTEKSAELRAAEANITDFDTEYRNVSDLVDGLKKTDPDEAVQYAEMRDTMKVGLTSLRAEHQAATDELANFKGQIDKARRIYKVAQAMNKALERSQSAQQEVFGRIKEQVAFDTVRTNLNRAFANLNTAVERRKNNSIIATPSPKELSPAPDPAIKVIDLGRVGQRVTGYKET